MRGFILGEYHTATDWSLVLTSKTIDPPEPKTYQVDLDGRDGSLDLSESLAGEIKYKDRTVTMTFCMTEGSFEDRITLMRTITNYLHGRKRKIVEPDDPEHYFIGRMKISSVVHKQSYTTFTITASCEPWRYFREKITRHCDIHASASDPVKIVFTNRGARTSCPILTVTGVVTVVLSGSSVVLTAGSYRLTSIKLSAGVNEVMLYGSGSVTFEYEEADL